ncbi:hypothetical protein Ciccas_005294 [Cichlidogyrus casuarinus]|uniref:Uncharacterized protein n=1 Tax=Cichlidogyrus casuarinus TaxID=1844966 RepID=A0ABD2Q924_9PLAT
MDGKRQTRKLYRTRSDLERERVDNSREAHSNYMDKLRKRMSLSTEKAGTLKAPKGPPKQMEVYERREVYSFSFGKKKAPKLTRRHTMLVSTDSAIQPMVTRPKLQETLRQVNDPANAGMLDPKFKSATLQRQAYSIGFNSPYSVRSA